MPEQNPGNALGGARSAYLKGAAHQPVDWREWSEATFHEARRQDKPILLDIGAVWCHWCHVMDRESYENPEIAQLINAHYVPVKVDRDERPDIDARYQTAVSALTGQGGWPLTAFLTPDGKPFYGGTYFPPDDKFGRPGMKRVLESIASNWRTHKEQILDSAGKIAAALVEIEEVKRGGTKANREVLDGILTSVSRLFDPRYGGFGNAPKFPHPSALDLLLESYLESQQAWQLATVTLTLERMGRGGDYDQLGGGFHRYSVDERWIVPHFEKMSYDNSGLLVNYLRAYQITGDEFFREIAEGILGFIENVLTHPEGGFYASQDADYSLEDDGDYWTWTLDEVKNALDPREAEVIAQYYHVEPAGEMHHNASKNVLFIDQPPQAIATRIGLSVEAVREIIQRTKTKLFDARAKRPTPYVDKTIYASWNGMMISALFEAYRVLASEGARDRALMALDLLLRTAYDPNKGMYHSLVEGESRIEGLLDDQIFMVAALLDAYEVTGERPYFERALELMETTIRRFWDNSGGGFFDTARDLGPREGSLSLARKPFQDSPTPSGNSMGALVLDRLASLADRPDFREKAEAILDLFAPKAAEYGLFAAMYGVALANHLRAPVEVVVVGRPHEEATKRLLEAAHRVPRPGKRVLALPPEAAKERSLPPGLLSTIPHLPLDGHPVALVCVGTSCQPPVSDAEALEEALLVKQA